MGASAAHGGTVLLNGIVLRHEGLERNVTCGGDVASRAALGLPGDRPIIATGHQPGLHHGGLIAKDMAVRAMAQRHGGAEVHLLLDTDVDFDALIDVPVQVDGIWQVQQQSVFNGHSPLECMQAQWAHFDLDPRVIRTSDLLDTPAGQSMLEAMRSDPGRCTDTLREAIAAVPGSGLRPPYGDELPLWAAPVGQPTVRHIATPSDLDDAEVLLFPRAVLTTAIMRLAVCDLFVHGTGGAMYDRVTDRWVQAWLGQTPPPFAMVTADVYVDHAALTRSAAALEQATVAVRTVRHDGGDPQLKQRLLAAIEALPRGGPERRQAFAQMHVQLQQQSAQAAIAAEQQLAVVSTQHDVLARRDFPMVSMPQAVCEAFQATCDEAFGSLVG